MTFTESSDFCIIFPPFCYLIVAYKFWTGLPRPLQHMRGYRYEIYYMYIITFTSRHVIVLLRFLCGMLCCGVTLHIGFGSAPQFGQNVVVAVEPVYAAGTLSERTKKISDTKVAVQTLFIWMGLHNSKWHTVICIYLLKHILVSKYTM